MKRKLLYLILIFSVAYTKAQPIDELRIFSENFFNRFHLPSLAIGLQSNGTIIFNEAYGFSDLEHSVPANAKTVYRIASISKTITAVAIMQLVERGLIKLDDDVRKYLPDFPKKKWTFTIRQLLNHTSGVRTYRAKEFNSVRSFASLKEVVDYFKDDSLMHQPGTAYLYSTLSYNLLGLIIEKVSKKTFQKYLEENIFVPAKMSSTIVDSYRKLIPNRASGYEKDSLRVLVNSTLSDLTIKFPGGGILSTTEDLLNFSISILNETLIKRTTLDSMLVKTKLLNGKIINYGLGIIVNKDDYQLDYFGHSGVGTGFVSNLIIYPDKNLSVVHLINFRDRNSYNPALLLAHKFLGDQVELPKISSAEKLFNITTEFSIDSALAFYKIISLDSSALYETSLEQLKLFGNDLLNAGLTAYAIAAFNFITTENPNYADGFIGLGEAYLKDNNKGLALKAFRKALVIAPNHPLALKKVKELSS